MPMASDLTRPSRNLPPSCAARRSYEGVKNGSGCYAPQMLGVSTSRNGGPMNAVTRHVEPIAEMLFLALDLGGTTWKLAFGITGEPEPRLRTMPARQLDQLLEEIAAAKRRFHLAPDAPVRSCYEAGRDGFWL